MAVGHIVTNQGKNIILNRVFTAAPTMLAPLNFRTGTGTNTPSASDTALQTPVTVAAAFLAGYPIIPPNSSLTDLQIRCYLDTTQANGNSLTEFGILNADGTPKLFSRTVFAPISKTSSIQVIFAEKEVF
jgi:hypothetical protein